VSIHTAPIHSPRLIENIYWVAQTRETLLKGKSQYSWPPCTNWFRSAPFTTQATLMRRSTVLSLSLQLLFPAKTTGSWRSSQKADSAIFKGGKKGHYVIWPKVNGTACIRHQCRKTAVLSCPRYLINSGVKKWTQFKYGLELWPPDTQSKSKCLYSINCLCFLKCAVPLVECHFADT